MIGIQEMKQLEGKHVEITCESGQVLKSFCEEYVQAEEEEEEPMLFLSGNLAVLQSDIKKVRVLK